MSVDTGAQLEGIERVETVTVWCGGCGSWFTGQITRVLDYEHDTASVAAFMEGGSSVLNTVSCGGCGWSYVVDDWVALVQRAVEKAFLIIPENHRHRAQQIRQEFIGRAVAGPDPVVQSFLFEPVMLVGHSELRELLAPSMTMPDQAPQADKHTVQMSGPPLPAETSAPDKSLIRRKAQSLDLLAELLSDDDDDSSGLSISSHAEQAPGAWAKPESVDDDAMPTVIPDDFIAGLDNADDESSPLTVVHQSNVDDNAEEQTGEHHIVTSAAPEPMVTSEDESDVLEEQRASDELPAGAHEENRHDDDLSTDGIVMADPPVLIESTHRGHDSDVTSGVHVASSQNATKIEDVLTSEAEVSGSSENASHVPLEEDDAPSITLEGHRVVLRLTASEAQRNALSALKTTLYLQGHDTEAGLAIALTLRFVGRDDDVAPPPLVQMIQSNNETHIAALKALGKTFEVVTVLSCDRLEPSRRVFILPLEENAQALTKRLDEVTQAAEELITAGDFPLFGNLAHNFGEYSFDKMGTAAEVHLARGIVEYWTQPEHEALLLNVLAFPRHWWRAIQGRIVASCLQFGLALDGGLRSEMRSVSGLEDEALVVELLARFSEVSLNLRASELDPLDEWGNWDSLLAWAEGLGVIVDEKIEEIAARSLAAAERAVDTDGSEPELSMDAIEISLADAIDIASIGAMNVAEYLAGDGADDSSRMDPATVDMSVDELISALGDSKRRAGACVQLLSRAPAEHSATVFDCVMKMNGSELAIVVPSILPVVASYVPLFRNALFADGAAHRLSAAMLLAEVGDERSLNPILNMLLDPEERQWKLLAEAAARLGPMVIQPALSRAAVDETGTERIMVLLGHVGALFPEALEDVAQRYDDPAVGACIERSQALARELDRPETPPFAYRLTALLDAANEERK